MVVLGIDAHKRSHTVVAVDERGRQLSTKTLGTTTADHLALLRWAEQHGEQRQWAVEDCRHLSRRLERDLLSAGQQVVRVAPKLMAHARDSARTYGKHVDSISYWSKLFALPKESLLPPDAGLSDGLQELGLGLTRLEPPIARLISLARTNTVEVGSASRWAGIPPTAGRRSDVGHNGETGC